MSADVVTPAEDVASAAKAFSLQIWNGTVLQSIVRDLTAHRELHKHFFPLVSRDYVGLALAAVALFIAAGGGVGGGGVLVPVYILVLGFSTGASVGLSNITIFGGAIANLIFNAPRRHSLKDAPLIDWDLIMVMEPVTILGTILGGYLNKLSPGWLTTFLLALLMTFMTWKLAGRGISTWKAETKEHRAAELPAAGISSAEGAPADLTQPLLSTEPVHITDVLPPTPPTEMTLAEALRHSYTNSLTLTEGLEDIHPIKGRRSSRQLRRSVDSDTLPVFRRTRSSLLPDALPSLPSLPSSPTSRASSPFIPQQPGSSQARATNPRSPLRPARLEDDRSAISAPAGKPGAPTAASHGPDDDMRNQNHTNGDVESMRHGEQEETAGPMPESQEPPARSFGQSQLGQWLHKGHWMGSRPEGDTKALESIQLGESQQLPWPKILILVTMFGGVLASDATKTRLRCGSLIYWLAVLSVVPFILALAAGVRVYLLRKFHIKERNGWQWTDGDVHWNERATIVYPAVCSLAGLVAGLFGIGGGVIKGPLMLEMNVLPDVAAATSATMILFTSLVGSLVFISFGAIGLDYGIAVFVIGLVSTLLGQFACYRLMQILQRRSIPIFAMTGLMAMAMVGVWIQTSLSTWQAVQTGHVLDYGTICGHTLSDS